MRCTTIIDKEHNEEVVIYLHKDAPIAQRIREICEENGEELIGYENSSIVMLQLRDVYCFALEDGKLYALTSQKRLMLKQR